MRVRRQKTFSLSRDALMTCAYEGMLKAHATLRTPDTRRNANDEVEVERFMFYALLPTRQMANLNRRHLFERIKRIKVMCQRHLQLFQRIPFVFNIFFICVMLVAYNNTPRRLKIMLYADFTSEIIFYTFAIRFPSRGFVGGQTSTSF